MGVCNGCLRPPQLPRCCSHTHTQTVSLLLTSLVTVNISLTNQVGLRLAVHY